LIFSSSSEWLNHDMFRWGEFSIAIDALLYFYARGGAIPNNSLQWLTCGGKRRYSIA
jgi:hypothetical protein